MALTAALVVGGLSAAATAGSSMYGAAQAAKGQKKANQLAENAQAENYRINEQNAYLDAVNSYLNAQQRGVDNKRYDEGVTREEKQRAFTNSLASAGQIDAEGNSTRFDPLTGTWRTNTSARGRVDADRRHQQTDANYTQSVEGSTMGGMREHARGVGGGIGANASRALSQELMARYGATQGRTPEQMEGAGIERNVAGVTDPLKTGGNMAMLAGYRQGNSGNDALIGALARQSQGGTRSAVANARYDAPTQAFSEREAAAKSTLSPATTLNERASAPLGGAPVFAGDNSGALLAAITRGQAAGVGTSLNPRSGNMLGVTQRPGSNTAYTPLNASGNQAVSYGKAISGLLTDPQTQALAKGAYDWWDKPKTYADNAPTGYGTKAMPDRGFQEGDYPAFR